MRTDTNRESKTGYTRWEPVTTDVKAADGYESDESGRETWLTQEMAENQVGVFAV
jgi:hypothetical protein